MLVARKSSRACWKHGAAVDFLKMNLFALYSLLVSFEMIAVCNVSTFSQFARNS